jgi:hypothetical protein
MQQGTPPCQSDVEKDNGISYVTSQPFDPPDSTEGNWQAAKPIRDVPKSLMNITAAFTASNPE